MSDAVNAAEEQPTATEQALTEMLAMMREDRAARQAAAAQPPQKSAEELIAQFQAQLAAQREADAKQAEEAAREQRKPWWEDANDESAEAGGLDGVEAAKRAEAQIREDLEAQNKALQERLDALEAQQKTVAEHAETAAAVAVQDRQARFASELNALDPEFYPRVNNSPEWQQFLSEMNPTTMQPYGEALRAAYQNGNAHHAHNLVQAFRARAAEQAPEGPLPTSGAQVVPFPGGRAAHVDAAPRGADRLPAAPTATGHQGTPVVTQETLQELKRRIASGVYGASEAGDKAFSEAMQAIAQAGRDGRLQV